MRPPQPTRRSILRTGGTIVAILGTGALAGCVEGLGNSGSAGQDPLAGVPPTGDALVTVDVNTFFADEGVRTTYDAWLQTRAELEYYDGPTTLEGSLDEFEQREGVDLRDLSQFTAFFSFDGDSGTNANDGTGYLFEGGWDEDELVGMFDHDHIEYTESTYGEHTIHEPDDEYTATVGVLDDGRYVAGGPDAVRSAIDVERGETEPIDGPIADAYRDTTAGPVRFATHVRPEWFPEEIEEGEMSLDLSPVRSIETAAGAIYRDGNRRGLRVALRAPDAATAEDLQDVVDGSLTLASGEASGPHTPEFVADLLDDVAVAQDGANVTLSVERTVDELEEMAAEFGDYTTGSASSSASDSGTARAPPQASFSWDHDADARLVTVTHTAGDAIRADNVGITGDGFVDVDGADVTEPTTWAAVTDDKEIMAGDRVTVGARADCRLLLVWEDENASSVLARYEGPEA